MVEGSVRAFALDALDQQPTPETLVARAGVTLDPRGRKLSTPVAMQYLNGTLAVIDQARTVVEIDGNRKLNLRSIPTSLSWQALGALGSDPTGHLLFVDSGSRSLLDYPSLSQRPADPPPVRLDSSSAPGLAFDHGVVAAPRIACR